jgi:hypothetical protein
MTENELMDGVVAVRPFVPAKDFEVSQQFYRNLGFDVVSLGDAVAHVGIGHFGFLLQKFYVKELADNFMMHLLVTNLDQWWASISGLRLESRYEVRAPLAPKLEPWGLRVAYVFDPSGVLWHVAEEAGSE